MFTFRCSRDIARSGLIIPGRLGVARLGMLSAMTLGVCGCGGGGKTSSVIPSTGIPSTPTKLTVTAKPGAITISWNASAGAAQYQLYRSTQSGAETADGSPTTTLSSVEASIPAGKTYYYQIAAINSAGQSVRSSEVSVTLLDAVYGLNFSPYTQSGQDPNNSASSTVSPGQVDALLQKIKGYTYWIRTFGTQNGLEAIPLKAKQQGFSTAVGAYIGTDPAVNNAQIANLISAAQAGNVSLAIVGNEYLLANDNSPNPDPQAESKLIAYIQQVKAQTNINVTYADTWDEIVNKHPNVMKAVDVIAVNIYPFYENATIDQALAKLQSDYQLTVQAANGKQVIITETGWPSSGASPSFSPAAAPSAANAAKYFNDVENWARTSNISLFYFSAFDEPYKANYNDYASWGIWDTNGNMKPGTASVFLH